LPTPRTFDHATWTSETGKIHTILAAHNPRHATTAINILAAYTADSGNARVKRRAFGMAELSLCHFRAGDAATAVSVGHRALDVAAGIRSHRLVEHLDTLRAEALRHPRNGDAVELAHRIRPVKTT
jgi:fructose-1,6-bisphosphatase/inositol monophosphatase family enzyme